MSRYRSMGWTFRKRIKVLPGITLNVSRSGLSTTIGPKGARLTVGGRRRPRVTTSIPGTGVSFTRTLGTRRIIAANQPKRQSRVPFLLSVLLLVFAGSVLLSYIAHRAA
jgi:hypothetical protein